MKKVTVLFICTLLMTTSGCGDSDNNRRSREMYPVDREQPVQESSMISITFTDCGLPRGIIKAVHAVELRTENGTKQHLDGGVSVLLFDSNGHSSAIITADNAVIHANQDMEAMGNVIMKSENNTVITTEYVRKSAKDNMIRSDRFVTITRPEVTIRGEGFESDQGLKKYRIFRGSGETLITQ